MRLVTAMTARKSGGRNGKETAKIMMLAIIKLKFMICAFSARLLKLNKQIATKAKMPQDSSPEVERRKKYQRPTLQKAKNCSKIKTIFELRKAILKHLTLLQSTNMFQAQESLERLICQPV